MHAAYGVDEDPLLYDLVLNTERTSMETCAQARMRPRRKPGIRGNPGLPRHPQRQDPAAHIRIKLRERFTIGMGVTGVDVTVSGGRVVMTGTAVHSALVADASEIAGEVPGVKEVVNRMIVVHGPRALG